MIGKIQTKDTNAHGAMEEAAIEKAISSSLKKISSSNDDEMTGAMKENRVGLKKAPVNKDAQTRAMYNEFELDNSSGKDNMTEAMNERRSAEQSSHRNTGDK